MVNAGVLASGVSLEANKIITARGASRPHSDITGAVARPSLLAQVVIKPILNCGNLRLSGQRRWHFAETRIDFHLNSAHPVIDPLSECMTRERNSGVKITLTVIGKSATPAGDHYG